MTSCTHDRYLSTARHTHRCRQKQAHPVSTAHTGTLLPTPPPNTPSPSKTCLSKAPPPPPQRSTHNVAGLHRPFSISTRLLRRILLFAPPALQARRERCLPTSRPKAAVPRTHACTTHSHAALSVAHTGTHACLQYTLCLCKPRFAPCTRANPPPAAAAVGFYNPPTPTPAVLPPQYTSQCASGLEQLAGPEKKPQPPQRRASRASACAPCK